MTKSKHIRNNHQKPFTPEQREMMAWMKAKHEGREVQYELDKRVRELRAKVQEAEAELSRLQNPT